MFGNLLRPPHLYRFLLAFAAGTAAVMIYLTAEHFKVIPGTGALDEEAPRPAILGEQSVLVRPVPGDCPENISPMLALEAIRHLVRIPEIEVIGARSALALGESLTDGRPGSVTIETAWQLRIECHIREGDFHLSASLSRVADGETIWTLERPFGAEELHQFISGLNRGLAGQLDFEIPALLAAVPVADPAAYLDFLQARWLLHKGGPNLSEAESLLEKAIELEPEWAPAIAALAYSRLLQPVEDPDLAAERLRAATAGLERAIELVPEFPDAHLYRSLIAHRFEWDWARAYDAARAALAAAPGDAAILAVASTAAFTLGKFEEGVQWLNKAIALDPLVLSHRIKYGLMLEFNGQPRAAIEAYRELKLRDPVYPGVHAFLGRALIVGGRIKLALPHMEYERHAFWRKYGTVLALYALERQGEADKKFARFIDQFSGEAAVQIAEIKAYTGRADEAFDWLERAVEQRDPGISELIGNPLLENLANEPRWRTLLESLRLPGPEDTP